MPDPLKTLAPIIEPVAPPDAASAGHDGALMAGGLVFLFLVLLALLIRRWRRRAPLRALRRLALDSADPRAGANALAHLIDALDPARVRELTPWRAELDRLRFAPSSPADGETLARLCEEAVVFIQTWEAGKSFIPALKRTPPHRVGEGPGDKASSVAENQTPHR